VADWDELADYDAVTIEHLRTRGNSKWGHHDEDVLAAWVAEMDFPLAPPIRQALNELKDFLFARVYRGSAAKADVGKAQRLLHELFDYFVAHPDELGAQAREPFELSLLYI